MRNIVRRGLVAALIVSIALPAAVGNAAPVGAGGRASTPTPEEWARHGLQQVPKQTPGEVGILGRTAPTGVNPYVGTVLDPTTVDWAYWRAVTEAAGQQRASQRQAAAAPLVYDEVEPDDVQGQNDTQATAEFIDGFGTSRRGTPAAQILGTLAESDLTPSPVASIEDDGSIPLANPTGLGGAPGVTVTQAVIGDGPHGSAGSGSGDFDFFGLTGVTVGQRLLASTATPGSNLDTVVVLWDSDGNLLALHDDVDFPANPDSRLAFTIPDAGDYFVMVIGYFSAPEDPFDSGSGSGAESEGTYSLRIGLDASDVDVFSFDLKAGDVVGSTVSGAATQLVMFEPDGEQAMGSSQDASGLYPTQSPLPGGGNATLDHVAPANGRYALEVSGAVGDYQVTLEAYRPEERQEKNQAQTLYVDFDGARINTAMWGGPGVVELSPLSAFLSRWGLTAADEDALIDAVLATVEENLRNDLRDRGGNSRFAVRIRNSRDNGPQFGEPNVSQLIVGGTIAESGIPTIGIAESIDPGNFGHEESALILLDILSDPAADFGDPSLNSYITPASDRIAFIGQAVGNIVAHEAGHYLGNWHVDQFNAEANIMDQGGNFPVLYGVGPDGVGGTTDDVDVDFGEDPFNPGEGFTGTEDTLVRTAFGLSKGRGFSS